MQTAAHLLVWARLQDVETVCMLQTRIASAAAMPCSGTDTSVQVLVGTFEYN